MEEAVVDLGNDACAEVFAINCMCVVVGQKLCREMNVKDRCLKGG